MTVTQITDNAYYLEQTGALVLFTSTPTSQIGELKTIAAKNLKEKPIIKYWGGNNLLPQERELLVSDNNIVGSLIQTKRDITLGVEPMAYMERFEKDSKGKMTRIIDEVAMPIEAKDFFEEIDIEDYMMTASADLLFHSNVFTEFICKAGGQVTSIQHKPCKFIRAEKQDNKGVINNYYHNGFWHKIQSKDAEITQIQAYKKKAEFQAKFLLHLGDKFLNDSYYNIPTWWGSRTWIELANAIAVFHKSNLKNGFTIRYLIEVDENYFKDNTTRAQTPEEIKESKLRTDKARQEITDTINEVLSGEENAGRAIFAEMRTLKTNGQQLSNVKITPIQADLKDEALIKLFEASNTATISAQAIHPTLAAIETAGKLSSGTEIRNAFLMYLAIKAPLPRRILWKPIDIVAKKNAWNPNIKYSFRDVELTALSENKSGIQQTHVVK